MGGWSYISIIIIDWLIKLNSSLLRRIPVRRFIANSTPTLLLLLSTRKQTTNQVITNQHIPQSIKGKCARSGKWRSLNFEIPQHLPRPVGLDIKPKESWRFIHLFLWSHRGTLISYPIQCSAVTWCIWITAEEYPDLDTTRRAQKTDFK